MCCSIVVFFSVVVDYSRCRNSFFVSFCSRLANCRMQFSFVSHCTDVGYDVRRFILSITFAQTFVVDVVVSLSTWVVVLSRWLKNTKSSIVGCRLSYAPWRSCIKLNRHEHINCERPTSIFKDFWAHFSDRRFSFFSFSLISVVFLHGFVIGYESENHRVDSWFSFSLFFVSFRCFSFSIWIVFVVRIVSFDQSLICL